MERPYDVILAGGGLVGGALACALADRGARVAVVEAVPPEGDGQPSFDDRHTALAPSSRYILEAWGLWPSLREALTPIRHIHISEAGGWGFTHLDAREAGMAALGWVLPNRSLGAVVAQRLAEASGVTLLAPAQVAAVEHGPGTVTVALDSGGERLSGRLLVVADGAGSRTRELAGLSARRRDYGHSALVTTLTPERHHEGWAYERFTREGSLAVLPIGAGRCTVVWSLPHARAAQYADGDEGALLEALQHALGYRLGRLQACGMRHVYPLQASWAPRLVTDRVALAGNAAHALHPVAAQGLNLALRDAAALAEAVAGRLEAGEDPGDEALLRAYARQRAPDIRRTQRLTDGLVRGFSLDLPPLRLLRSGALAALERSGPAKRTLLRIASGRLGPLPWAACRPPDATEEDAEL